MSVGIILPSYGALELLCRAVVSARQTTPQATLLLFDDGSPEWSRHWERELAALAGGGAIVQRYHASAGSLTRSWNAGLLACRDLGLTYAVLGNSDLLFAPGWWDPLRQALDEADFVGPVTNAPGHVVTQHVCRRLPSLEPTDRLLAATATRLRGAEVTLPAVEPTPRLNGFCWAGRTDRFWQYAFRPGEVFDPAFPLAGNEDEFQQRARQHGATLAIAGRSYVFHYRGGSRGLVGPARGWDRPTPRREPCVHLGPILDRGGTGCPRCWTHACEQLGQPVQRRRECRVCEAYDPV